MKSHKYCANRTESPERGRYVKKKMRHLLLLSALVLPIPATAQFCTWKIEVLDGASREVKQFRPGNDWLHISVADLPGYAECKVTPVNEYVFEGIEATRVEVYCSTANGQTTQVSSVASRKFGSDITTFQLMAAPVEVRGKPPNISVNATGYKEFTIRCGP